MISKLKHPSPMIILPESDREKEQANPRKRQRITYSADSTALQAALILALSAELHRATSDTIVKPSQSSASFCDKSSSLQGFATSGQLHNTTNTMMMACSKNSPRVLTSKQMLGPCPTDGKHHKVEVLNPTIPKSATTSAKMTIQPSLPSGKPLLAPPRLPHLKLGERLSRQKGWWNHVIGPPILRMLLSWLSDSCTDSWGM